MKATYVSVWDGGIEVRTSCEYDEVTMNVTDIETADVDGLDNLGEEYIELPDGRIIPREYFTVDSDCDEGVPPLSDEEIIFLRKLFYELNK